MILINTEMPTCCEHCFGRTDYFSTDRDGHYYDCCFADWEHRNLGFAYFGDEDEWHMERPEWCPLIEMDKSSDSCEICDELEKGDTIYMSNNWDGGVGYDYIRDIKYCPRCGKPLLTYKEKRQIWREKHNGIKTDI